MAIAAVLSSTVPMTLGLLTLIWAAVGFNSATLTPSGRLLTRSAHPEDRPAVFAAQFTLSHACWLVFYPLADWLMTRFGATVVMAVLATGAVMGLSLAIRFWSRDSDTAVVHSHPASTRDHPHLVGSGPHAHPRS